MKSINVEFISSRPLKGVLMEICHNFTKTVLIFQLVIGISLKTGSCFIWVSLFHVIAGISMPFKYFLFLQPQLFFGCNSTMCPYENFLAGIQPYLINEVQYRMECQAEPSSGISEWLFIFNLVVLTIIYMFSHIFMHRFPHIF